MLVRLKEDFRFIGNSREYRRGELLSVNECAITGNYILVRYLGLNNWVKDRIDKNVIEIIT